MRKLDLIAILILTLCSPLILSGQKVGVVLSGGGGSAMAHIGVLKALEENNIPIDYIAGSSMGALIGALYASGYSPLEIEAMVLSEKFKELTEGDLEDQFSYYQRQQQYDASYIRFRIKPDKPLVNSIPTHVYNSQQLDFYLMTLFASAEAAANYNFDSLMIPFRCVASDIYKKESVVFKNGYVGESVRASMTYPFYLQAIKVDSVLLFDGGLYDNFPKKLMKETFKPDFIIGSNVSSNAQKPEEDVLFSQLENMLSLPTDYSISDKEGILIDIKLDIATLDLSRIEESISKGYNETNLFMDSIKTRLNIRMSDKEMDERRLNFNREKVALHFESISISGLDKTQSNFIKASFGQVKDFNDLENVERLYYKLYADDKIKFIFPKAKYNSETGKYNLNLEILREKNLEIQIGGILSTSPINTGYASFKYNIFNKTSLSLGLNGYFGNVYQSAKLNVVLDVPAKIPFYWEPYLCINDYDYFKNSVSVFDEVQPPYIVTNEVYIGNSVGLPFILNSIFSLDYKYFEQSYSYYVNPDFSLKDDADNTQFNANTLGFTIDKFNYNFRQYASSGSKFYFNTRLVTGWENTNYAFPTDEQVNNQARRTWLEMHLEYSGYPVNTKLYSLGLLFEGYFSNMPDFTNYFGTIMETRQFQPLTESITLFQPRLRSTSWLAIGMKNVLKPIHNLQVRLEAYIFQPSIDFYVGTNGQLEKGLLFDNRYLVMTAAVVYHTKLGPISLNGNYYQFSDPETTILLNFGFTIFNNNAKD